MSRGLGDVYKRQQIVGGARQAVGHPRAVHEQVESQLVAGGGNVGANREVCQMIKNAGTTPVTHFTVIKNTKEGIKEQLDQYLADGVDHMLALRGDIPLGETTTCGDFDYATDLVKFVRDTYGDKFEIAVAGSPEGHISCRSLESDIAVLKQKQDNGADYIMTQLCWDMEQFKYWLDAIRKACLLYTSDAADEL